MSSPTDEIARLAAEMDRLANPGNPAAPGPAAPAPIRWRYADATKTATYGFLASLPLFAIY